MAMENLAMHTSGRAVIVTIDRLAWHEGMNRSREGGSSFDNPYPLGTAEAYSWLSGFIGHDDQRREEFAPIEAEATFLSSSAG